MVLLIGIISAGLALAYVLSRKREGRLFGQRRGSRLVEWDKAVGAIVPSGHPDSLWAQVTTQLLQRLGADPDAIEGVLQAHGFPAGSAAVKPLSPGERWPPPRPERLDLASELEKALVVGISLAAIDDDYGQVGDPLGPSPNGDELLKRRAEQIESEVFDTEEQAEYEFLVKAALVLQDMLEDTRDDQQKRYILRLRDHVEERIKTLEKRMDALLGSLGGTEHSWTGSPWAGTEYRRLYYFMMGVTNTLRKNKAHFPAFDALYRAKGLGYNVEEAYEHIARESPTLAAARQIGIRQLLAYDLRDVRALVRSTLPLR